MLSPEAIHCECEARTPRIARIARESSLKLVGTPCNRGTSALCEALQAVAKAFNIVNKGFMNPYSVVLILFAAGKRRLLQGILPVRNSLVCRFTVRSSLRFYCPPRAYCWRSSGVRLINLPAITFSIVVSASFICCSSSLLSFSDIMLSIAMIVFFLIYEEIYLTAHEEFSEFFVPEKIRVQFL